jgi:hypothetical protein
MAVILALVIEIVPEALLLWAIFTDRTNMGDFVSSFVQGTKLSRNKGKSVRKSVQKRVQGRGRTDGGQNRTPDGHGTEWALDWTQASTNEGKVMAYCTKHKKDHGSLPSVRKVEAETGVPKTTVAQIMKPMRD